MPTLPYLDANALASMLSWPVAIDAIARAAGDLDLAASPPRTVMATAQGELMLMPAQSADAVGVKVLTIAPDNPATGHPRIQALYVVFDAATLTPRALLDGAALTAVRTAAVSAFAITHLSRADATRLVVFGAGPQAHAHVQAISSIRPISSVTVAGRDAARAAALVARVIASGTAATVGTADAVSDADIVVCATTARTPLFAGSLLAADGCVVAVGSHEPDVRELDADVFRRADRVVVEDAATARREAGDIIMAIEAGALDPTRLTGLSQLGQLRPSTGISVFKSVGMGWEDLALAATVFRGAA